MKSVISGFQKELKKVLGQSDLKESTYRLEAIASEAIARQMNVSMGFESGTDLTAKDLSCCYFLVSWDGFRIAGVPFSEYESVARSARQFLERFIDGRSEKYDSAPGFSAFWDLRQETMKRLESDPRYRDGFRDLQGR